MKDKVYLNIEVDKATKEEINKISSLTGVRKGYLEARLIELGLEEYKKQNQL